MKTRFFSLIAILILTGSLAMAQTDNGKIAFGVLGGVNFQNLTGKDWDGSKLENDMIVGYHAGVSVQIPIVPQFYFQPGLLFSAKGGKWPDGTTDKLSYIELPLNVVYKGLLGNGYVMIGIGPYVGYAIIGKSIVDNVKSDVEFTKVVEVGDPVDVCYYKAFDAGANLFAGYELGNGIFFQLNTQLGLIKINPEDKRITDDETSVKNTGFGLSLGYRF